MICFTFPGCPRGSLGSSPAGQEPAQSLAAGLGAGQESPPAQGGVERRPRLCRSAGGGGAGWDPAAAAAALRSAESEGTVSYTPTASSSAGFTVTVLK